MAAISAGLSVLPAQAAEPEDILFGHYRLIPQGESMSATSTEDDVYLKMASPFKTGRNRNGYTIVAITIQTSSFDDDDEITASIYDGQSAPTQLIGTLTQDSRNNQIVRLETASPFALNQSQGEMRSGMG